MATLRDIKRKIDAVRKTSQITKAMNMVAASKLRGAQQNMEKFHPYALKFREFIGRLAAIATRPVVSWDERFTSKLAERGAKRVGEQDSVAACYMLQDYLDWRSRASRRET